MTIARALIAPSGRLQVLPDRLGIPFEKIALLQGDSDHFVAGGEPARRIRAGPVWINAHNFGDVALPFGGYKESGCSREMGKDVPELYTETKAVAVAL